MTREYLEELADNKPEELALLFARKVVGIREAILCEEYNPFNGKSIFFIRGGSDEELPDYPTDWTAVINAIEKSGMKFSLWTDMRGRVARCGFPENGISFDCVKSPNWHPCCAIMICGILAKQNK